MSGRFINAKCQLCGKSETWARKEHYVGSRSMPSYKLVYFNIRGRAELARLCLAEAQQEYEDFRYAYPPGADWSADKASAPFNTLPYLEVNGKRRVGQSLSVARYIARKHRLMGSDIEEEAEIDSLVQATHDVIDVLYRVFYSQTEREKVPLREKVRVQVEKLESYLEKHQLRGCCFVGSTVTIADLYVFYLCDELFPMERGQGHNPGMAWPRLQAHYEFIASQPQIRKWLDQRPQTPL